MAVERRPARRIARRRVGLRLREGQTVRREADLGRMTVRAALGPEPGDREAAARARQEDLRGLPVDYDGWASSGLDGWGWNDVAATFWSLETDRDFGATDLHGADGPLTVRRWRRDEMSHAQLAFYDGMVERAGQRYRLPN